MNINEKREACARMMGYKLVHPPRGPRGEVVADRYYTGDNWIVASNYCPWESLKQADELKTALRHKDIAITTWCPVMLGGIVTVELWKMGGHYKAGGLTEGSALVDAVARMEVDCGH